MNKHDETIAGLRALGFRQVFSGRATRNSEWSRGGESSFLVGQRSLRVRRAGQTIAKSTSATDLRIHRALREVGRRAGEWAGVQNARDEFSRLTMVAGVLAFPYREIVMEG